MKKLIIAFGLLGFFGIGTQEAQAAECSYLLKNSYGQTQKVIKGRDYSMQTACFEAKRGCENEARRSYYGAYCVAANNSGGYGNGGHNGGGYGNGGNHGGGYGNGGYGSRCTVELIDRWGYRIQSFQSNGGYGNGGYNGGGYGNSNPSVCRDALRDCNKYKIDYNYPSARCQTRR